MKSSRRSFIGYSAAIATTIALPSVAKSQDLTKQGNTFSKDRFDPWIEVLPEAIKYNAKALHKLSGNRPVLAVVKNNGYGLGDVNVAKILDEIPEVAGFAAVKTDACLSLKNAELRKPVLHMGMASESDFFELARKDIQLSIFDPNMKSILENISVKTKKSVKVHLYIDTGMSRMGIPYHRALPWIRGISNSNKIDIQGSFMGFTEDPEYDKEQLKRFTNLNSKAISGNMNMGKLHAASSNGIYHFPEAALDMVRPGISLYGAYPSFPDAEREIQELKVAFRLNARVVRVEKLRPGDSVSYGRNYVAEKDVWIATLPIGHADGYLRKAVNGAKVLVNGRLYPVIGAVSASHTILEVGEEESIKVGDLATLIGPDHPEIHPSHISTTVGVSVYDILMHMNPGLPKVII